MLAKVEDAVRRGARNAAPAYTLILGAGASFGVVPTAKEMLGCPDVKTKKIHDKCIPLWLSSQGDSKDVFLTDDARMACVVEFWRFFKEANSSNSQVDQIALDSAGLPTQEYVSAAYQAIFNTSCVGGVDTPERHRAYMREVTMATQAGSIPLNATHFYLASLLSLQRRIGESGPNGQLLYKGQREFARTIFTTNFDPLLQTSLQLFQLLYYMTDRPEFLSADALQTDEHPAIHLFYAHGSVHRPFLANTEAQIEQLKLQNSRDLAAYLGTHGVIVLGYSGWDDCLLDALNQTKTFSNNLYWLVRGKESITPKVSKFLEEHSNSYWVNISDGGHFMASLHGRLCPGVPNTEMLYNPIRPLICQLNCVSLSNVGKSEPDRKGTLLLSGVGEAPVEVDSLRLQVIKRLEGLQRSFTGENGIEKFDELWRQAELSFANESWDIAANAYKTLAHDENFADPERKTCAQFRWAVCLSEAGKESDSLEAYTALIESGGTSTAYKAKALVNRGIIFGSFGIQEAEVADYNEVIDMEGVSDDQIASALYNRAIHFAASGQSDIAMEDYQSIMELPAAPSEYILLAIYNRGVLREEAGDLDRALESYTDLIVRAPPAELYTKALTSRGNIYKRFDRLDDAIGDFSQVIDMTDSRDVDIALSKFNRGICYNLKGDFNSAVRDLSSCIQSKSLPRHKVTDAYLGLGVAFQGLGKRKEAAQQYVKVIESTDAMGHERDMANQALVGLQVN